MAIALAIVPASAFGAKGGDSLIGVAPASTGEFADGGRFADPQDVAVNQGGAGGVAPGTTYVVDAANHRIQRLSPSGQFVSTWGRDVIAAGAPNANGTGFEVCDTTAGTPNSAADCKAGVGGSLGGELNAPQGIAVDQDTGQVYVTDRDNNRVQQYGPNGAFVRAWGWDVVTDGSPSDPGSVAGFQICATAADCKAGVPGSGVGQFATSSASPRLDVTTDGNPATGSVFVADPGFVFMPNHRILKFGIDGTPDATTPTIGASVFANEPEHLAVDDTTLYVFDSRDSDIERFDAVSGARLAPIAESALTAAYPSPPADLNGLVSQGLEIDPASGNLLAVIDPNIPADVDTVIYEIANPAAAFVVQEIHMQGSAGQAINGLGLAHGAGFDRLYVSASSGFLGHRLLTLDDDGAGPLGVTLDLPTAIGAHEVSLEGSVDPNGPTGLPTSYEFQYSKDGVSWTPVAGSALSDPDGGAAQPVTAAVTGLEANTAYQARLVARRAFAHGLPAISSPPVTFTTDAPPPTVVPLAANRISATGAQLRASLNPEGTPAQWHFEYVTDAQFQQTGWNDALRIPVPDAPATGTFARIVAEGVGDLEPETTYHYRLVASNGQEVAPGDTVVEGAARTFATRAAPVIDGRAYEMVTAPDKPSRRGGEGTPVFGIPGAFPMTALPSPDGARLLWSGGLGTIVSDEGGTAFPHSRPFEVFERASDRWRPNGIFNIPAIDAAVDALDIMDASSADLLTTTWRIEAAQFPSTSSHGTRVLGDSGGYLNSGWYDFMAGQPSPEPGWLTGSDAAIVGDDRSFMVRYSSGNEYRGLLGDTPAEDPSNLQVAGAAPYLSGPPDWRPHELVNECTPGTVVPSRDAQGTHVLIRGTGTVDSGSPTVSGVVATTGAFAAGQLVAGPGIPAGTTIDSVGAGTLTLSANSTASASGVALTAVDPAADTTDDTVATRSCGAGSVPSVRGAVPGGDSFSVLNAASDDGRRIFFSAPDPSTTVANEIGEDVVGLGGRDGRARCATVSGSDLEGFSNFAEHVGAATECPAQVYVRQYDSDGTPSVRWVSRSEIPNQRADGLFRASFYEGASTDGRFVFFRTNQPLVADDPNAGSDVQTGSAQDDSWDLYRYELPESRDDDPSGPQAGGLLRITGGGTGTADPNTNGGATDTGSAVRHMSADGQRVYFLTRAKLPDAGADNVPPAGGQTVPGGTVSQNATRNLYLYDGRSDSYRFIAQLPYDTIRSTLEACASSNPLPSYTRDSQGGIGASSCMHGTTSGDALVFESRAQLTEDDADGAADVYLYDAQADELVRVSAPPNGESTYACNVVGSNVVDPSVQCNADLGVHPAQWGDDIGVGGLSGLRRLNVSEDASGELRAVYFETPLPMVPDDVNGRHFDVYEWRDGELSLISPGTSDDHAFYSGNSRDGTDVFFQTTERISAWEIEDVDGDVYDARIGGGLPDPPRPPVICDLLATPCQGPGAGGPEPFARETAGPGGGNSTAPRRRLSVSVGAKARRRAAQTGVLALRVRANVGGRVRALARARVDGRGGKRLRRVGGAAKRVRAGKAVALRLRLSPAARRELRSGDALRVLLTVRMTGAPWRSMAVVLRRAGR